MPVEARMRCTIKTVHPPQTTGKGEVTQQADVSLQAVSGGADEDDPNAQWSKWTPTANLEMTIMNPDALPFFEPGTEYRVVFTKHQPQMARTKDDEDD